MEIKRQQVGAYSLCYQEGKLLKQNIRLLYPYVDKFVVVIGQVEISQCNPLLTDQVSARSIRTLEDPLKKIIVIDFNVYQSKEDMTKLAMSFLVADIVIQLDSDEFWPIDVLLKAVSEIESGADRVFIDHLIYFRSVRNILSHETIGDFYFSPARAWRRLEDATLGHYSGSWQHDDRTIISRDVFLTNPLFIHHLGWVSKNQIKRKLNFYGRGRGYKMPPFKLFKFWVLPRMLKTLITMGPNNVRIASNRNTRPSLEILDVIKNFSSHKPFSKSENHIA